MNDNKTGIEKEVKADTPKAPINSAAIKNIPTGPLASDRPEPFTTDRYFEFMFADQDLRWEEMEARKEIEARHRGIRDPQSLRQKQQAITALGPGHPGAAQGSDLFL